MKLKIISSEQCGGSGRKARISDGFICEILKFLLHGECIKGS
jgi:hypothetical protein